VTRSHLFLYSHPATNHPNPEPRRLQRAGLALLVLALSATAAGGAWKVRTSPTAKGNPWAVVSNAAGDELALYSDKNNQVHLQFKLAGTFAALTPGHCPTFQIDAQQTLYHLALDQGCHVDHKRVLIDVGVVRKRVLVSAAVEQLMNGTQLELRYVTADGAYHAADFPLQGSSLAINRALGRGVRVRAQ
jgi:hypothetical protein